MRRTVLLLASMILAVLSASGAAWKAAAQLGPQRPNILFVLTDDQDPESIAKMGKLQSRLVDQGASFPNAFVTTPQCCPSRVTFLRGQYAHNHGITGNTPKWGGGYVKFHNSGAERSTVATWLHGAGYATAYVGKYLNGYGKKRTTKFVPPGWDLWRGRLGGQGGDTYEVNHNGAIKSFDRTELHETDLYSREAEQFVRNRARGVPWFMVVAPSAPHSPASAAKRHQGMFKDLKMPKPPSFNEGDVSDKPRQVRNQPRLGAMGIAKAQEYWRQRQRSLQSVDDLVGNLVDALADTRQLDETYVVYASDNGYLLYRHRVKAKAWPYEESIGVPFFVRGPGVPSGATREQLVANTDWAPTIADWAQVEPPASVDGRSFDPLLGASPPASWRERLLIEFFQGPRRSYRGIRTANGETYVEYANEDREYYELATDPWQLRSGHRAPENSQRLGELSADLSGLEDCAGEVCRQREDAP